MCLAISELPPSVPLRVLTDVEKPTFFEHAEMLISAGLVEGRAIRDPYGNSIAVLWRLTWSGHEFVDAVRNDEVWGRARKKILKSNASFTFDLFMDALKAEVAEGLPRLS